MNHCLRDRLEQRLRELPVLPHSLVKLLAVDSKSPEFFDALVEVVEIEPGFASRILAVANSAVSASQAPVTTIRAAVARIGARGASDLVMALSVTRVFVPHDAWEKSLWRHALQVAIAARELVRLLPETTIDPDEAYVAGLLHDVGRFVLFQEGPEELRAVDEGSWDTPAGLLAEEREICGLTHAELGALACERWKLPDRIRECVRHHHDPAKGEPRTTLEELIRIVRVADLAMFPSALPGSRRLEDESDEVVRARLANALPALANLPSEQLRAFLHEVGERETQILHSLGLV
ncbi:MAG: HDOD domain-containing protein [Planctomycetes bacterium]|nr:HDOD domain-containing protein [Planctomycetota bacterium]